MKYPILQQIVSNHGILSPELVDGLAAVLPHFPVIVKWGLGPRLKYRACNANASIDAQLKNGNWVRDAFIAGVVFDKLIKAGYTAPENY